MTAPVVYHQTRNIRIDGGEYEPVFLHLEDGKYGRVDGQLWSRLAEGKRRD